MENRTHKTVSCVSDLAGRASCQAENSDPLGGSPFTAAAEGETDEQQPVFQVLSCPKDTDSWTIHNHEDKGLISHLHCFFQCLCVPETASC